MTARPRIVLAVHRALLRTSRTPLVGVWALAYRIATRLWAAYLARGEPGATAYVRGSVGQEDWLPGLSDIDVAVVLAQDPAGPGVARDRARRRWERPREVFPPLDLLLDYPFFFEEDELREVAGTSVLTARRGGERNADARRLLNRPGLYGSMADWRHLAGPDRLPPEPARDSQLRRIAGWLELVYWWQWVFPACVDPSGPRTSALCVKLVAEPARIWLWLAHGERASGRQDVLQRALRRMPQEERALRRALELNRSLPDAPDPPLTEFLPVLVRMSARIAELVAGQVSAEGATEVRLAGADPPELILAEGGWRPIQALPGGRDPALLPLCDWRGLTSPLSADECLAPLPGHPGDPAVLAAAAPSQPPAVYPALRAGDLMVFPAVERWRSTLRAVRCPVTDPVSFALADASPVARFPEVRGWSARDTAVRAVAEHRAWLARNDAESGRRVLGRLFTAARAALFLESIEEGAPELALTVTETARRLGQRSAGARAVAEEGLARYRRFALHRTPPPPAAIAAMRELVGGLPGYGDPRYAPPAGRPAFDTA